MLQYALDVQLHINSSWEEEMSQPKWQPWASLTTLFSAQEAIPETHKALLLQFVLASPPPVQVRRRLARMFRSHRILWHHISWWIPQRHASIHAKERAGSEQRGLFSGAPNVRGESGPKNWVREPLRMA